MSNLPVMPEKPSLPSPAPSKRRGGWVRSMMGLIMLVMLATLAILIGLSQPYLVVVVLVISSPFLLVGVHYALWGKAWRQQIIDQVNAEEAAQPATGYQAQDAADDEPWLRGEIRE